MLRHLWSTIIMSHIFLCLVFAYSILLPLKRDSVLPLRISNWETQTQIQRKSSGLQKLTTHLCDFLRGFLTQVQGGESRDFTWMRLSLSCPSEAAVGASCQQEGSRARSHCSWKGYGALPSARKEEFKCPCGSTVDLTAQKKLWDEKGI